MPSVELISANRGTAITRNPVPTCACGHKRSIDYRKSIIRMKCRIRSAERQLFVYDIVRARNSRLDKDYYPTKSLTCVQHPLDKLLKHGFRAGHGEARPAKRIETATTLAAISLECVQNEMHRNNLCLWLEIIIANGVSQMSMGCGSFTSANGEAFVIPCSVMLCRDYRKGISRIRRIEPSRVETEHDTVSKCADAYRLKAKRVI